MTLLWHCHITQGFEEINLLFLRVKRGCLPLILSELTSQTIPVIMRISLLLNTIQPDQSKPKKPCWKEMGFQQKLSEKAYLIVQNDWSCYGPAGQFWLLESALRLYIIITCISSLYLGWIPLGWSRSESVIQDQSNHSTSKEQTNPL